MDFVTFRLTASQLTELHNSVVKGMEHLKSSRADTMVGMLARCLSEVETESKPIDTISHTINHRGMGIYPDNAVLNALIYPSTELRVSKDIDLRDNILAWVTEIRKSMERLKDPGFIKDAAAEQAKIQSQIVWDRKGVDIALTKESLLVVNNMWKFSWTSAHFGHPGKVRFHHGHTPSSRFVKIVAPNPKFVDGTWISREGDMEVGFWVPQNRRKKFEELFDKYAKSLGMTGPIEFLPSLVPRRLQARL